ncbi:hypothetical protein [Streptomyces sp. NPDC089919]|uniref:hypothetical protein n=1 Tax=Streptomyces sp. NPDC089919 TaxID=3155188 RepID=UPI00342794DE
MPSTTEPVEQLPQGYALLGLMTPVVEDEESDRGYERIDEATVSLLRRETRIGLARGPVTAVDGGYDIPLMCVVQTHPESSVRWTRLVLDLSPTPGATVADMSPVLVEGGTPVEIETSLGAGLGFSVAGTPLGAEVTPQVLRRRTVYCPRITSSGIGFATAYWDFRASDREFLHVNEELRLLVQAPPATPVQATVTLRTRIRPRGLARALRLSGKLATLDAPCRLA